MRSGFGVAANVSYDVLRRLGAGLAGLGYDDAWSNDFGGADGLGALAALGEGGPSLRLGLGVAALDRRSPPDLARAVDEWGLAPGGRLLLGVGAGFSPKPLGVVREGIQDLRAVLGGDIRIGVAAMGPRMCRLAGEVADFVFLNWMTPERIRWARRLIRAGAEAQGREAVFAGAEAQGREAESVEVAAYVRAALGPDAPHRLAVEAGRYAAMPHYGRHFRAMGAEPGRVGVAAAHPSQITAALAPYRDVLDTLVVRGLPGEPTLEAHLEIAASAR